MQNPVQYMNQQQQASQSPQLVQVLPQPPRIYQKYHSKQSQVLGVTQICVGILCIVVNAAGITLETGTYNDLMPIGHGIWGGLFFILSGSFGIPAGRAKSKCMIVTFMVLSIVSACVAIGCVLIIGAIGLSIDVVYDCDYYYYNYPCEMNSQSAMIAMGAMLVLLAVVEGVVAIWSSAICCAAVCCGSQLSQGQIIQANAPVVQYSAQPQVVCLTSQTQGVGFSQQPLHAIPQQVFYPQQQQQLFYPQQQQPATSLLQTPGPQATGVMTPPPYGQRPPPEQEAKTST